MTDPFEAKAFRTLKGFLDSEEPDEENYFHFCASLRIHGDHIPFDEISRTLGVLPTMMRRKGERKGPRSPEYKDDAWHFQPDVAETEPLDAHLIEILNVVRPHTEYIRSLKSRFKVDIFCGYRSNCGHAGFEVAHSCLELFNLLEIPFGVSVILA